MAFASGDTVYKISRSIRSDVRLLTITYAGSTTLEERREAFADMLDEAISANIGKVLIDFSNVDLVAYDAIDGVKFAWHVAQLPYLQKIAYVAPGKEDDQAISSLTQTYHLDVRVFSSRRAARKWLATPEDPGRRSGKPRKGSISEGASQLV